MPDENVDDQAGSKVGASNPAIYAIPKNWLAIGGVIVTGIVALCGFFGFQTFSDFKSIVTDMENRLESIKDEQAFLAETTDFYRERVITEVVRDLSTSFTSLSSSIPADRAQAMLTKLNNNQELLERYYDQIEPESASRQDDKDTPKNEADRTEVFCAHLRYLIDCHSAVVSLVGVVSLPTESTTASAEIRKSKDLWKELEDCPDLTKKKMRQWGFNPEAFVPYALGALSTQESLKIEESELAYQHALVQFDKAIDADSHFGRAYGMKAFVLGRQMKPILAMVDSDPAILPRVRELFEQRLANFKEALKWGFDRTERGLTLNNLATVEAKFATFLVERDQNAGDRVTELLDAADQHSIQAVSIPESHPVVYATRAEVICHRARIEGIPDDARKLQEMQSEVIHLSKVAQSNGFNLRGRAASWEEFIEDWEILNALDPGDGTFLERIRSVVGFTS